MSTPVMPRLTGRIRRANPIPRESVDPAHQPDLNHKASSREEELNLGEEGRDRICPTVALEFLHRHVELLVEKASSDRREPDDEGDHLQVLGLTE